MKKVLVILGPTAIGKTDLGLNLAKKFNGEIISCDSRQVYRGLDIGTGKLPSQKSPASPSEATPKAGEAGRAKVKSQKYQNYWEINGIKIWMYDVVEPQTQYSVADYVKDAWKVIKDIEKRDKLPIVVGGTGLYLKALFEGLPNLAIPVDEKLRGTLQQLSLQQLQEKLQTMSPVKWKLLNESDRQNPRRLLRSIELKTMYPYRQQMKNLEFRIKNYDILKIGLMAPRQILNQRIDAWVLSRIDQGMVDEAASFHQQGLTFSRMRQLGLVYGCLADLLEGKITREQFAPVLKTKIHQYAKRQMTWFKNPSAGSGFINWFNISQSGWKKKVEKEVFSWYDAGDDQTN